MPGPLHDRCSGRVANNGGERSYDNGGLVSKEYRALPQVKTLFILEG